MTDMPMRLRKMTGFLLLCALAWAVAGPALAQDTTYQATVPVADTSNAQRNHAFAVALQHVLARVAGHPVDAAGTRAATYVRHYQYRRAPAGAPTPFLLTVSFAPSAIRHLVGDEGIPAPAAEVAAGAGADSGVPPGAIGGGDSTLWVSNLHSALDFAGALSALRTAPGVDAVTLRQARDGGMLLDVHTAIPLRRVLGALESGGRVAASGNPHAGADASLRWLK